MTTTTDARPTCRAEVKTVISPFGARRRRYDYHHCGRPARFVKEFPNVRHLEPAYFCGTHAKKHPEARELPAAR